MTEKTAILCLQGVNAMDTKDALDAWRRVFLVMVPELKQWQGSPNHSTWAMAARKNIQRIAVKVTT